MIMKILAIIGFMAIISTVCFIAMDKLVKYEKEHGGLDEEE